MKKALILAMALTLAVTGSLFAQGRRLVAEPNATFTPGVGIGGFGVAGAGPTTTNNDDSCDIGTTPAATLLLPYFEANRTDRNTIFTIVNTSREAAIAHITLWTDWSFPVLDFNVYLTGYDVQGLSLRDIIFNGQIAPLPTGERGGTTDMGSLVTGTGLSPYGPISLPRPNPNPRFAGIAGSGALGCTNLPGAIPEGLRAAIETALTTGVYVLPGVTGGCATTQRVGSTAGADTAPFHPAGLAVGYVTIDVANKCSLRLPTDPQYYTSDILFDNVLTGDYETFDATAASNYAGGSPLVHIRAIPEGGNPGVLPAGTQALTNLPFTFYSRYQNRAAGTDPRLRVADRRQPLPALWAARYTQGGGLNTSFKMWREGVTDNVTTTCANVSLNSQLPITEIVRFDEHENFSTIISGGVSPVVSVGSNEASRVPVNAALFPPHPTTAGDVGGWMYLNLDSQAAPLAGGTGTNNPLFPATAYSPRRPSQSWVVVSMTGTGASAGALSVDFDATWLGNGCTPAQGLTQASVAGGTALVGPAPNTNP